ncbi:unnamed protein product [Brachionus calyciflorus]|uniref:DNA helicase Pif1-like 2B domain-containing protein n=1 Tax=Brachionus calyciflorus TaxID=104777 RepID=A0A813NP44_9BILA|nr:unnamed protein product [Brachionus calyciflorus]
MEVSYGRSRVYDNHNLIRLPDGVVCNGNLVNEIFGEDALEINETILARSRAPNRELLSNTQLLDRETDQVVEEHDDLVEEVLRRTPHGFPPHILNLKVGALVMLLKNWSFADGLCNRTRLTVRHINNHSVRCSVLNGPLQGHEYVFCRTEFRSSLTEAGTRIRRFQFPFRLAFAMTINKSQGQTFNRVGLLLRTTVFSHGQLYVALSRVRNFDSIRILVA